MKLYLSEGNAKNLVSLIENNKANFPGLHLQPILNRLWLALQDNEQVTDERIQAYEKLGSAKLNDPDLNSRFREGVYVLHSQISELSKLSEFNPQIIDALTKKLRYKINDFTINYANKTLTNESVNQFRTEFMAVLHSHDDTLSRQNNFCQLFLVNLALAFLTLGLAVGIQLVTSKLLTGRASFFCADSAALCQVTQIERTAMEVMVPAS